MLYRTCVGNSVHWLPGLLLSINLCNDTLRYLFFLSFTCVLIEVFFFRQVHGIFSFIFVPFVLNFQLIVIVVIAFVTLLSSYLLQCACILLFTVLLSRLA